MRIRNPAYYELTVLRIRDDYPGYDFYPSRISDPTLATREEEKMSSPSFFCNHKYQKLK